MLKRAALLCGLVTTVGVATLAAATAMAASSRGSSRLDDTPVRGCVRCGTMLKRYAQQAMTEANIGVDEITRRTPIFQVLCGPFFGPDSRGMLASVALAAGCGGSMEWAVFRDYGGPWKLVLDRPNGAFLSRSGVHIVERVGAPRRGDPRCAPSAWKTRIWHWNGSVFTPSAWKMTLATWTPADVPLARPQGGALQELQRPGLEHGLDGGRREPSSTPWQAWQPVAPAATAGRPRSSPGTRPSASGSA